MGTRMPGISLWSDRWGDRFSGGGDADGRCIFSDPGEEPVRGNTVDGRGAFRLGGLRGVRRGGAKGAVSHQEHPHTAVIRAEAGNLILR